MKKTKSFLCAFAVLPAMMLAGNVSEADLSRSTFGNALQDHFVDAARKNSGLRQARFSAIRDEKSARRYVDYVRNVIRSKFTFPQAKTPLRAKVTSVYRKDGVAARNILYYSRPDYPVTATLFLPDKAGKFPAVLFTVGHSVSGRKSETYLRCCVTLAKLGFAVLTVDPVSQGERLQFTDVKQIIPLTSSGEHNMRGKQLFLLGETLGAWRVWDLIRGIDYLETVPEADLSQLAVTGNSGGGTMASFVGALDDRVKIIAPSCYITTWRRNIENELPVDAEQIIPGILQDGIEMADLLISRAPAPVLIMGQKKDFFDARGTRESFSEVRKIYTLLGKEENAALFIGPAEHGFSEENRNAMYNFLRDNVLGDKTKIQEPADLPLPPPAALNAAPEGKVCRLPGAKSLHEMIFSMLPAEKRKLSQKIVAAKLCEMLQITSPDTVPEYRVLRVLPTADDKIYLSRFALETEKDRVMSMLYYPAWNGNYHLPVAEEIMLYIPHLAAEKELPLEAGKTSLPIWGLDVRGAGAFAPSGANQIDRRFFAPYQADYHYDALGLMTGQSFFGGKVRDILGAVALLRQAGAKKIYLKARGIGSVPALVAAFLLQDKIAGVELVDAPDSWRSMAAKEYTLYPQSVMPFGILSVADLPELRKMTPDLAATFTDEPALPKK